MADCLVRTGEESVTLSSSVVQRLLRRGDGDAALLYLALARHHGTVMPRALAGELRWERARIETAEGVLRELGLIAPAAAGAEEPVSADERPDYGAAEVADKLERSAEFRGLTDQVERRLGRRLTTPDIGVLLGLHDYLGLPPDVIYLLVCHCAERTEQRLGPLRRPGMRQIEKEGYAWARMGIDTQAEAAAYLKKWALRREALGGYMRVLGLGERTPSPSEEKYLLAWQEMDFAPEAVALAYDKTVLRCHELKWPYLNGILKKWHEAGLHTVSEIEAGDRPTRAQQPPAPDRTQTPARPEERPGGSAWMERYARNLRKERGD